MVKGLKDGGFTDDQINVVLDGREATQAALDMAEEGDIVVLQADDVRLVISDVMEYKEKRMGSKPVELLPIKQRTSYGED